MSQHSGRHLTLFQDPFRYVLGPAVALRPNGEWVVAFNATSRHEISAAFPRGYLHPANDPDYQNLSIRSRDEGQTWDAPRPIPGYDWRGVESPGLCALGNGDLLANVYRRKFLTAEAARQDSTVVGGIYLPPHPWVGTHEGTFVHRSRDGGLTWESSAPVTVDPFVAGHSSRGAIELADGRVLLALGGTDPFFDTYFSERPDRFPIGEFQGNERDAQGRIKPGCSPVFVVTSRDDGRTWGPPRVIARDAAVSFSEPSLVQLQSGRLLCHVRAAKGGRGQLYQVSSNDGGRTWSPLVETPMWGAPAHLVALPGGRVLSVYGYRREPYGVRGCVSHDEGRTWDYANEIIIRNDLVGKIIGFPSSIALPDGRVFTVYFDDDGTGATSIKGTLFDPLNADAK